MKHVQMILILTVAFYALQTESVAAVPDGEPRSQAVAFSDLDLSQPADAAVLYRRIERAATHVCEPLKARDPARATRFRKCVAAAFARAVADVHAPLLTEHYVILTGKSTLSPPEARLNR